MNSEIELWQFILNALNRSEPVMLMCVVESSGSSPGRRGFKMAVTKNSMLGSIGGGVMEHKFVELAKEKLKSQSNKSLLRKQQHNKLAPKDQSGMICSGEQTIVLFSLEKIHAKQIEALIDSLKNFRSGTLRLSSSSFNFLDQPAFKDFYLDSNEDSWEYIERTGYKDHLYIIGGGHCSLALSELMSKMNFFIHIYDDRKDLNTFESNNFAHEKVLVNDYSELDKIISPGPNNYLVVMTFGYRSDDIVVRTLIDKDFKYFGVLGSEAKIEKMMADWKKDGLPEHKLKSLHAPVGISINSQTTMEIAVSIAAEIVSVKNANEKSATGRNNAN